MHRVFAQADDRNRSAHRLLELLGYLQIGLFFLRAHAPPTEALKRRGGGHALPKVDRPRRMSAVQRLCDDRWRGRLDRRAAIRRAALRDPAASAAASIGAGV
jgi:hypothetical protein